MQIDPKLVERVPHPDNVKKFDLDIAESDPQWPLRFQEFRSRILAAFEQQNPDDEGIQQQVDGDDKATDTPRILAINHVGSTAVPKLAAKAIIDIGLVLTDNSLAAEPFYVRRLKAAGFRQLLRNPQWYEHRFFRAREPIMCHLHVWGPGNPEVERHRIFRDWSTQHDDDRELYARSKRECSALAKEPGESMDEYNDRKQGALREILMRAFAKLGYISS